MLAEIHPKLPMRNKTLTREYYIKNLGFNELGLEDYEGYLMVKKDHIEIHFFEFKELDPKENYGQVYIRTNDIKGFYQDLKSKNVRIHPNGALEAKPWRQVEFSLLDPDNNLLTFGEAI